MQEHVLPTVIRRHEAEATDLVEPLHRTADGIGRATFVAAEVTARRTIAESARSTEAAAAKAVTTTAELTAGRTVAEVTARRTIAKAAAAEAATKAAAAELTAGRAVTEVTARRTIAKAAAAEAVATEVTARRTVSAPRTQLALMNLGHQSAALAVRADLADQLVASLRRFDSCLGQRRCVEEHILAIWPQHEAETLAAIVPLHLGLNRPGATLRIVVRKHCVSYP
ncbi:hypothetical protein HMPREF9946_01188 [Acetobacteraceae bacterium AT-5844]|nr:hypothetical protein HMPREF9946_01188 [Acetobacteraceae bacterium AT-5844]